MSTVLGRPRSVNKVSLLTPKLAPTGNNSAKHQTEGITAGGRNRIDHRPTTANHTHKPWTSVEYRKHVLRAERSNCQVCQAVYKTACSGQHLSRSQEAVEASSPALEKSPLSQAATTAWHAQGAAKRAPMRKTSVSNDCLK